LMVRQHHQASDEEMFRHTSCHTSGGWRTAVSLYHSPATNT